MVLNPLLIVPFPTNGETLEDVIQKEFQTENGITFDCGQGQCNAKDIGTKSKTTMLLQCPYVLIVSVTRRIQGTTDRINDKIELGNQSFAIHQGTDHQKSFQMLGSITHSVHG